MKYFKKINSTKKLIIKILEENDRLMEVKELFRDKRLYNTPSISCGYAFAYLEFENKILSDSNGKVFLLKK